MHAITLAHRLLSLFPNDSSDLGFDSGYIRVIRQLVKVAAANANRPLLYFDIGCDKARAKWAYDNYHTLAWVARHGFGYVALPRDMLPDNPTSLYRLVIVLLWSAIQRNVQDLAKLSKTVRPTLTYLSLPRDELRADHRAFLRVMARCSPKVNKNEVRAPGSSGEDPEALEQ
ncbi:hypothetical protein FRC07_007143, partial [Ceratobasidium sp. 392]